MQTRNPLPFLPWVLLCALLPLRTAGGEETAAAAAIPAGNWLIAGPLDAVTPAFSEAAPEEEARALLNEDWIDLEEAWPATGSAVIAFNGPIGAWGTIETDSESGSILLPSAAPGTAAVPRAACLAGYLETFKRMELEAEIDASDPFVFFCDGSERGRRDVPAGLAKDAPGPGEDAGAAGGDGKPAPLPVKIKLTLDLGKHGIWIKTLSLPRKERPAWTVKVAFRAALPEGDPDFPEWSVDPVHSFFDLEEMRRMVSIGDIALSPDGKRLALAYSRKEPESVSWIEILEAPDWRRGHLVRPGGGLHDPTFSPDGRLLAFRGGRTLYVYDTKERTLKEVCQAEGMERYFWAPDGRAVYYLAHEKKAAPSGDFERAKHLRDRLSDWDETVRLFMAPLDGGASKALTAAGEFGLTACAVSPDGERLALVRRTPIEGRPFFESEFLLLDPETGKTENLIQRRFPFENGPSSLVWSPAGDRIAFAAPPRETPLPGQGPESNAYDTCLYVLDVGSRALQRLSDRFDATVAGPLTWSGQDGKIYFIAQVRAFQKLCRIDPSPSGALEILDAPSSSLSAFRAADDAPVVSLVGSSLDQAPMAYLMGLEGSTLEKIATFDPNAAFMKQHRCAAFERFNVQNDEGALLDGWIFYPPRFTPERKWPLMVYFYGGTEPQDERFSIHQYQWFPANGYVLYVVNPSGAVGYGRAFADLHCNDWGKRAGKDIIEGVKAVLDAKPFIDPARLGAYGGSYGGFMTLSLATETDLFRAACSMYGIADLASYWGGGTWGYTYGDTAMGGSYPWNNPELFAGRSPLYHADKVSAAILLLHGDADTNVPPIESEEMFAALEVLGKECALVRFHGEDHGIAGKFSNLVAHRRMILEWFDKYLKDAPEAWEARWKK